MKKLMLFVIVFAALVYPYNVTITPFEYKDLGNLSLPPMNVTIMMDCDAKAIVSHVTSDGDPISGASTMLKYVQYDNPLLSSGSTDGNGYVTHKLMGNIAYMSGIFVLVMEKNGFMNREAHFLIDECLLPEPPPPPPLPPQQNVTPPENNTPPSPPQQNVSPPPPANDTAPIAPLPNLTANESNDQGADNAGGSQIPFCPIGYVLGLLSLIATYKSRR